MAEVRKLDFSESAPILEEEDEATLAAIDRGIKAADEGRVVPLEEVRFGVRKLLHSPVQVYYRLYEDKRLIEILHFWHTARRAPIV